MRGGLHTLCDLDEKKMSIKEFALLIIIFHD